MKRVLVFNVLSFMLGILLKNSLLGIVIITILFILCEICNVMSKMLKKWNFIILLISFFIGIIYGSCFNNFREEEVIIYNNSSAILIGTVCDEGVNKGTYYQYTLRNNYINGKKIKSKVLLRSKTKLEYGNRIKAYSECKLPKKASNDGGFDYSKYLTTKDVYIIAETQDTSMLQEDLLAIEKVSYIIRNKVREFTSSNFNKESEEILNALIIGDSNGIEEEIRDNYKKAGMIHLLVVSGGHTAFLILLLGYIISIFKPNPNMTKIISIVVIFIYMFVTGLSPSVLRAGIGIIIVTIGKLIGRQNDGFTTVFLVALILLLYNPNMLFSLSFLLSFGGVLGIMVCYPQIEKLLHKIPQKIREPMALTISAQLFITPITIYSFNIIYLGGFISNIFALTLAGLIMMSGIVLFVIYLTVPFIVKLPADTLSLIITIMNKIAEFFGNVECFSIYVITPSKISIIVYYLFLIYIFTTKDIKTNNIAKEMIIYNKKYANFNLHFKKIISWISIFIIIVSNLKIIDLDKTLKIAVIDVGHGDSILITTPNNKSILIDTGDSYIQNGKTTNQGEQTVVPYLLRHKVKKLDFLILTHMDSDHIGGYESIANAINIDKLGLSINSSQKKEYNMVKEVADKKNISIKSLKSGDTFIFDEIKFSVLMPEVTEDIENENNDSIVLLVEYGRKKVLFMGDLEAEGEEKLLEKYKNLDVDVLKLGHHGSKTSSSENFINSVKPEVALISVGNRFKSIPSENVLNRLSSIYAKVYRTDKNGEIDIIINDKELQVYTTY